MDRKEQLNNLWIRVRRKLYALANGATSNYDPKQGKFKRDAVKPVNRHEDITELEADWDRARSATAKERVIWDGLCFLFLDSPPAYKKAALPYMPLKHRDALRTQVVRQTRGTRDWKMAIAFARHPQTGEMLSLRLAADLYGVSKDTVARYRNQYVGGNAS